jgi:hypothetical protein
VAHAESTEGITVSSSGSILGAADAGVVYEDDEGFWATASGGSGDIDVAVSEETGTVASGSSSLRYRAVSGSKAWINIQHTFTATQDWSGYDNMAFYWYGRNSGEVFTVTVEAPFYADRFVGSFVDDFGGWRRVVLRLSGFDSVGSPDWDSVGKMMIGVSNCDTATWYIDKLTLETTTVPEGDVDVLRYASHSTLDETLRKDADYVASLCDLYMCWWWDANVARDMDPIIPVLEYRNVNAISDRKEEFQVAVENGWVLVDENGEYVYEQGWPQNKIMDTGSQTYRDYIADWMTESMANGFDGVWADNSGEIYPQTDWRLSAMPINPRTGQIYTDEDWLDDHIAFINYLKASLPDQLICSNGMLYNGRSFYRDQGLYEIFLEEAEFDVLFIEGIFNDGNAMPYSEDDWRKSVDLVIWLQDNFLNDAEHSVVLRSLATSSVPTSKNGFSGFIFASSLMGISNSDQNFICAKGNMESSYTQALFDIDLGLPIEEYHIIEGTHVYEREFTKVRVLVNPTSTSYNVDLGDSYLTMDGDSVTSIEMPRYSGIILITP